MGVDYCIDYFTKKPIDSKGRKILAERISKKVGGKLVFKDRHKEVHLSKPFYNLVVKNINRLETDIRYNRLGFSLWQSIQERKNGGHIHVSIDGVHLSKVGIGQELFQDNVKSIIGLATFIFGALENPIYGVFSIDFLEKDYPPKIMALKLPPIKWLNFFGKDYVEKIGEQNLLNASAYKTEKIKNGILIMLSSDSYEPMEKAEKLEEYLKRFF